MGQPRVGVRVGCLSVRTQGPGAGAGHSTGPGAGRLQSPGTLLSLETFLLSHLLPLGTLHGLGHLAEST